MALLIFAGSLLLSMFIGLPIAFSLIICALSLMYFLDMTDIQIITQNMWNGANNFPLLAVPFFMLAGEFMNAGGMTKRIIGIAMTWVGHVRGGMGYVAVFAAIIMASLSGSAAADTAALAAILLPMMREAGYKLNRTGGLIGAGGIIAPVIPPSVAMILYGVTGQISITKLFLAGIVPGIIMGMGLLLTWRLLAKSENVQTSPKSTLRDRLKKTREGFWALLLPVIIVGGLRIGIFTPTEAAVIAAAYSLFVGVFIYRGINLGSLYGLMLNAAKTTAVIMFLVAAASVSAWLIAAADIPAQLTELLAPVMHSQTLLILTLMLLIFIIGTAMDLTPTILVMTPVLVPLIKQAGIDPVYFGVLFVINTSIGLITPPVGTVLNVICGIGKISMDELVKGIWPFLLTCVAILILLVLFPQLVLFPLALMT
ncbi:TRAP transporter large permease subunit [Escherichia sp. E2748]|uniref:TRAP transporter large permease subunit n=1 Tax=unclassified Escherichia TaxID=2608889 RepID=UPI00107F87BF|nr:MULTISPECIES: TRAP transporter large permease subunit [unclassified Escherichia]TGB69688.1 L-dehydroascorbate transporter large permease subunit [Escherichia coli]TGC14720.1 L-dehydroascorbate transporter large permease subunit [Escherichia sp. E4385]TLI86907.1 TRAP transporter large permease subunit [Escherichia sp. E2748]TLI97432.1 TRAP transporter large permease subunit [Escherichia sp. E4385]TLJ00085.1 TRAP transporter large permease subunit [Escherichia sp. E4736]